MSCGHAFSEPKLFWEKVSGWISRPNVAVVAKTKRIRIPTAFGSGLLMTAASRENRSVAIVFLTCCRRGFTFFFLRKNAISSPFDLPSCRHRPGQSDGPIYDEQCHIFQGTQIQYPEFSLMYQSLRLGRFFGLARGLFG